MKVIKAFTWLKKLGGGSILDQSHILDMAHYLWVTLKKFYHALILKVSSLKVQSDDIAEIF